MGDSFRLSLSIYEKLHLEEASLVHARTINNIPHNIYGIQAKFQKEWFAQQFRDIVVSYCIPDMSWYIPGYVLL